jgi:hypothetical protein
MSYVVPVATPLGMATPVIDVVLETVYVVIAVEPITSPVTSAKFVPVIVIPVLGDGPVDGDTAVTVGMAGQ